MKEFIELIYAGAIIFAIFEIALMFKLWAMCNNIRKLTRFSVYNAIENEYNSKIVTFNGFSLGDIVTDIKTNKKYEIFAFQFGALRPISCYEMKDDQKTVEIKYFKESEISK